MKIFAAIFPIILYLVLILLQVSLLSEYIPDSLVSSVKVMVIGLVFGITILFSNYFFSKTMKVAKTDLGGFTGLLKGFLIGFLVVSFLALFYYIVNKPALNFSLFFNDFLPHFVADVSPGAMEEMAHRGGTVHFLSLFYGKSIALLGGSIPFGLIHILRLLFGLGTDAMHIIGVCFIGLMYSLIYLRFGVLACFACHWIWNTLVSAWVNVFNLPQNGGMQILESAWTTMIVLVLCSIYFAMPYLRIKLSASNPLK